MRYIKLLPILLLIQCTEVTQNGGLKDENEAKIYSVNIIAEYNKEPKEKDTLEGSITTELKSQIESTDSWHSTDYTLNDFDLKGKVKHVGETLHSIDFDENNEKQISKGDSIIYVFNEKGLLIKEGVFNSGDSLKWHVRYNYDSKDNLIKQSIIHEEGWGTNFEILYQYNTKQQLVMEIKTSQLLENFSYDYNSQGKLLQKKHLSKENEVVKTAYYSYNSEGKIDSVITKTNSGELWSKQFYKYNEFFKIVESYSEGEPINCAGRNRWFYTYNSVGDVKKEKTHDLIVNHVYRYDKRINWIANTSYYGDKPNFLVRRQIEYFEN